MTQDRLSAGPLPPSYRTTLAGPLDRATLRAARCMQYCGKPVEKYSIWGLCRAIYLAARLTSIFLDRLSVLQVPRLFFRRRRELHVRGCLETLRPELLGIPSSGLKAVECRILTL